MIVVAAAAAAVVADDFVDADDAVVAVFVEGIVDVVGDGRGIEDLLSKSLSR